MAEDQNLECFKYGKFFHYPSFRNGQEKVIMDMNLSQNNKGHFLLIAPNGTGKTISSLCSVLPLAFQNNLKIIYLCRTNSQNRRVIDELEQISSHLVKNYESFHINAISIRGRKDMCINDQLIDLELDPEDSMELCERFRKNDICKLFVNLRILDELEREPFKIAP